MDWGVLVGFALLLTLAIVALRLLWHWLIILLILGPPAYLGIVAGHVVGASLDSVGAGLLVAVIVAGLLTGALRVALRALWRAC